MIRHFSLAFALLPLCVCLAVEQEKEMADNDIDNAADLLDYDEEENTTEAAAQNDAGGAENATKKQVKGSYVSIHSSGFRDFLLKPELLRAIVDCGFEHPSEGLPPHPVPSETAFSHFLSPSQFKTSAYHRRSSGWTWCARPRAAWGRRPCSSLPLSSSWSLLMDKSASSSCATPGEKRKEKQGSDGERILTNHSLSLLIFALSC